MSDKMHPVYTAEQGEGLCLQNTSFPAGGKLHIVALEKKVSSLLSWSLALFPFHCLQLSSLSSVELFCVLIPDTVTGTLITARLQTLTRKRIDCAGVVTNIALCSQTHYKVFNRGTRRGFLCVPIKNVSESYSQHL